MCTLDQQWKLCVNKSCAIFLSKLSHLLLINYLCFLCGLFSSHASDSMQTKERCRPVCASHLVVIYEGHSCLPGSYRRIFKRLYVGEPHLLKEKRRELTDAAETHNLSAILNGEPLYSFLFFSHIFGSAPVAVQCMSSTKFAHTRILFLW